MKQIKISCIVMLVCLWVSTSVWAQETIHVETEDTLPALIGDKKETVENLTLTGRLNGTDIKCIREMTALRILDMRDVGIVEGGDSYVTVSPGTITKSCFTKDNTITEYMFYNLGLEKIVLPESAVNGAGASAFSDLTNLEAVVLPPGLVGSIDSKAFYNCKNLTSVDIPKGVTEFGYAAFGECSNLETIDMPDYMIDLGINTFNNCRKLKSIRVPEGVTVIEGYQYHFGYVDGTFNGCTSLANVVLPQSLTTIEANAFSKCVSLVTINWPEKLEKIGSGAFRGTGITSVVLPGSVKDIGGDCFMDCVGITSITLPSSVENIGSACFMNCANLEELTLPDKLTSIQGSCFSNCIKLGEVHIPDNVTMIENEAFQGCTSLVSLIMGDKVTMIGRGAFANCTSLSTVKLSAMLKEFLSESSSFFTGTMGAFQKCESLREIELPASLDSIGPYTFAGCENLTSIIIPENVKSLQGVFLQCTSLKDVTLPKTLESLHCSFTKCSSLQEIVVPDGVTTIDGAFYNCNSLERVTLPKQLKRISHGHGKEFIGGSYEYLPTFEGCSSLQVLEIPESVDSIGYSSFNNCTNLQTINIPDQVKYIPFRTFFGCSQLADISLPTQLISIEKEAFWGCNSLKTVVIPANVGEIGDEAFRACTNLMSVNVPSSVTSIGSGVFQECYNLGSLIWDTELGMKENMLTTEHRNNCLIYVSEQTVIPSEWSGLNIIRNGVAQNVELLDTYPFMAAKDFIANKISYKHAYGFSTEKGTAAGWCTIALPFTVQKFIHEEKGIIAPFNSGIEGSHPFWLRELGQDGFKDVTTLEAYKPYIIAMPNSTEYDPQYNLTGTVVFMAESAEGIVVRATPKSLPCGETATYRLFPSFGNMQVSDNVYALNTYTYANCLPGSLFVRGTFPVNPFESYVITKEDSKCAPLFYSIGGEGGEITGLEEIMKKEEESLKVYTVGNVLYIDSDRDRNIFIYDITGRIVRVVEVCEGSNTVTGLSSGFYFLEGKKIAIK